jgi:hypothetical protein
MPDNDIQNIKMHYESKINWKLGSDADANYSDLDEDEEGSNRILWRLNPFIICLIENKICVFCIVSKQFLPCLEGENPYFIIWQKK